MPSKSWTRCCWPLAAASSCWAWRVGSELDAAWKNVQVSQIDAKTLSSLGGLGAVAVAEELVVLATEICHPLVRRRRQATADSG
jgi:hypothetical protein